MQLFVDSLTALLLTGVLIGVLLYHRKQHRLLVNSLIGLLVIAVLASMLVNHHEKRLNSNQHEAVHLALEQLHDKATFVGALDVDAVGKEGFPLEISPLWFRDEGLPMNVTVPGWHPWLDIAPLGDHAQQPPDPVIVRRDQAGFWYNPNNGIFRARVTPQFTEQSTVKLYNDLNGTSLTTLSQSTDRGRQPRPLFPAQVSTVPDGALTNADGPSLVPDRRNTLFRPDPRSKP